MNLSLFLSLSPFFFLERSERSEDSFQLSFIIQNNSGRELLFSEGLIIINIFLKNVIF